MSIIWVNIVNGLLERDIIQLMNFHLLTIVAMKNDGIKIANSSKTATIIVETFSLIITHQNCAYIGSVI